MLTRLSYHFPYYLATILGALLSISLIFLFENYLEAAIFINYFKSYVIFQASLILLELGGYTKLQQQIKLDNKTKNIAISLIAFHGLVFLSITSILLLVEGLIFASFFMIQVLLYSNYIWYYTALDKERAYYIILIIFRIILILISVLLILEINILPVLIALFLGKFLLLLKLEKWKFSSFLTDLLSFLKINKSIGLTNLITQIGNRFIDISILKIFPEKELIRIGIIKPILDRLGSMITQHIVNREMIRSAKNINLFKLIKIFALSTALILVLYLFCLVFLDSLPIYSFRDLNILCTLLIVTVVHAIIMRLVIFKEREHFFIYTGFFIYSTVAIMILMKYDFDYFILIGSILTINSLTGLFLLKIYDK